MATTNYSWNLPTVGGNQDAWGDLLNANWTALDTLLGGTSATEFAILDGATVTTAELNILDGVTATTAELNILDGVTASTAEINVLDGITATVTELNYTSGVTSGIQAQIDGKQDVDATLTAYAATLTAANKIPYATSVDVAGELDFKDEDDMASNSASAVPSQQSVKAYVDDKVDSVAQVPTAGITQFPVGAYTVWYSGGFSAAASLFDTIDASVTSFSVMDTSGGGYTQKTINYGTWMYMGRIYNVTGALVCRIA